MSRERADVKRGTAAAMNQPRWAILAACFVTVGFVGSVWYAFQVFFGALTREFGWTRAEGALGFSIFVVVYGAVGPFIGLLVDRFGPRRVVVGGALLLAAGFATSSQLTTLWQFYLSFGVLTALGFAASGWLVTVTVLQSWFRQRLGTATGIVSAGVGIGIQVLVPLEQSLIATFGWRQAFLLLALGTILVVLPPALVLRRGPAAEQPQHAGRTGEAGVPGPLTRDRSWTERSWTLRLAIRTRRFWLLWLGLLLLSASVQPLLAHQIVYMTDTGMSPFAAATVAGLIGLASVPAKVGWGMAADRIGREPTYTLGLGVVALAIVLLWLMSRVTNAWLPYVYAVMMGVGYAVTAALPSIVVADLFRGRSYGAIYGAVNTGNQLGTASGVWLAGAIFDLTGGYGPVFALALGSVAAGCLCIWLVAPRQTRGATPAAGVHALGR